MGSGTMPLKNYRTKKGYYLAQDFDEKIGGKFYFLIEPLLGFGNRAFFYVRKLPSGRYEVEGEAYILTNYENVKRHKNDAARKIKGKKLYYYHLDENGAIVEKELENEIQT